ncbi:MAG: thiosulfohydrolase SoxB [bacterium]|nr:thiosulfohydrolase SoxB [bacterium]
MQLSRREFVQMLAVAYLAGCSRSAGLGLSNQPENLYDVPKFGNLSILHYTDCHAQLLPIYFREPHINLGVGSMQGNPPHLVGDAFLEHFGLPKKGILQHAFTYLDYEQAAAQYGKVGGFAHLKTLLNQLRAVRPNSLLLDGGDTWQGSATSLWTHAQDMVDAQIALGVDVATGHWEFTYGADRVKEVIEKDYQKAGIDFVAQNVFDTGFGDPVFKPYTIREMGGNQVAVIGQAFPYTPIANPRYMIPDWSFGIREDQLQETIQRARDEGAEVVVLLSHNGMDVDLKLASRVTGLDAIMGGHTHDAIPRPVEVKNAGGTTLVTNAGSNGKFLSVLDFEVKGGKVTGYQYRLLPVFSNLLAADPEMSRLITQVRAPYLDKLNEKLAVTDETLYRRGNFNGTFDQVILDALMKELDAPLAFSPGFRWGVSLPAGQPITFEEVMTQTAITYPTVTRNVMPGSQIKAILEDVADNLFNQDPYYQQGGDMVRVGGLEYGIWPERKIGERIVDMTLDGKPLDLRKNYPVAGWAAVAAPIEGRPVWDVVADYLRSQKHIQSVKLNQPKILGVDGNPGMVLQ